ncbi:unnamed protein product [Rotaria sp. Silwood1]|nr:unnamed protein product [Rotaria sp. Silwood1]
MATSAKHVNVAIVDGGVAGLAAAKTLSESGLPLSKFLLEASVVYYKTDGPILSSELAESISDVCNQIVDNTGQENYSSSLDYFKSKQVYERVNEIVQDANLCQAVIDWLIKGEMDNNGASSLSDVSLGSYHEFEDSEGNDERQLGQQGFRSFIEYLRSSISEHKIQLNCEVTKLSRILFAGEAIHPRFFSTIHGAFESGIHEAQQILSIFEDNQ